MMKHKSVFLRILVITTLFGCKTYCDNGLLRDGVQVEYYNNKVKRSETAVKNCLCFGLTKRYYPNGNLLSTGQCVNGKNTGTWSYYDNNGAKNAVAEWEEGLLKNYTINVTSVDQVFYDSKNGTLSNNVGNTIIGDSNITELFNKSTEISLLNDTMFALTNYGSLIVLSKNLKVLYNLKKIHEQEFREKYNKRAINLEIDNNYLKDGIHYSVKDHFIYIKIYYRDSVEDIKIKSKTYQFPLQK